MQYSKAEKSALIAFCLDNLALTDRERALLREVNMHLVAGTIMSPSLAPEVAALFSRCREMIGLVPHA